jgi:hypothetical protein
MTSSLGTGLRSQNRLKTRYASVSVVSYIVPNNLGPVKVVNGRKTDYEHLIVMNTGVFETKTEQTANGMAKGVLAHKNVVDCPVVAYYVAMLVTNLWGGNPLNVGEQGWKERKVLVMDAKQLREMQVTNLAYPNRAPAPDPDPDPNPTPDPNHCRYRQAYSLQGLQQKCEDADSIVHAFRHLVTQYLTAGEISHDEIGAFNNWGAKDDTGEATATIQMYVAITHDMTVLPCCVAVWLCS